jgi:hypothetical protein
VTPERRDEVSTLRDPVDLLEVAEAALVALQALLEQDDG